MVEGKRRRPIDNRPRVRTPLLTTTMTTRAKATVTAAVAVAVAVATKTTAATHTQQSIKCSSTAAEQRRR